MQSKQKKLAIALLVITAVYFSFRWYNSKSNERTLVSSLFELDTAQVSSIKLYPKVNGHQEIRFQKNNQKWVVSSNQVESKIETIQIKSLMREILSVKPERLAARTANKWEKYHVNDSLGTHLVLENSAGETLANVMIGKFSFRQSPQTQQFQRGGEQSLSYVRNFEEEETYATKGFLSSTFNRDFNSFRDKTVLKLIPTDIKTVEINTKDESLQLNHSLNGWELNGLPADSSKVVQYLNQLRHLNNPKINDHYVANGNPAYQVIYKGDNMSDIIVQSYQEGNQFNIQSSLNKGVTFQSDSTGIFKKIFKRKEDFFQ